MANKLTIDTTPVAVITYKPGTGKVKTVTHISIKVAGVVVATAIKGGRWSQDAALSEFRRLPDTFTKTEAWGLYEGLKRLAA